MQKVEDNQQVVVPEQQIVLKNISNAQSSSNFYVELSGPSTVMSSTFCSSCNVPQQTLAQLIHEIQIAKNQMQQEDIDRLKLSMPRLVQKYIQF